MTEAIQPVTSDMIVQTSREMTEQGYRFVTMSAVELDAEHVDLLYHFDKDLDMKHYRLTVRKAEKVPSISNAIFAALLVENEIKDQFGIAFDGLVLDYGETFYLEEEMQRTPFCRYHVVKRTETPDAAPAS